MLLKEQRTKRSNERLLAHSRGRARRMGGEHEIRPSSQMVLLRRRENGARKAQAGSRRLFEPTKRIPKQRSYGFSRKRQH